MATEPVYDVLLDGERAVVVDATIFTGDATFALPDDEGVVVILKSHEVKNILLDWWLQNGSSQ